MGSILAGRHDEATINAKHADRDKMSLSEKIKLWNSRAIAGDVEDDDDDDSDDDESIDLGELSAHIDVISESKALAWLAARLRNRSLLQWETHGMADLEINKISQTILAALPTDTISKRQPPQQHQVSFRVEWGHMISELTDPFLDIAIAGCSSGKVQVTSVTAYIRQTWPLSEDGVLNLLRHRSWLKQPSPDLRGEEFSFCSAGLRFLHR